MHAGVRTTENGVRPWVRAALRCGAVLAVAALALTSAGTAFAAPTPPAPPAPSITVSPGQDPLAAAKATLGPMLDRLHELYREAEAATETYNGAVAKLTEQQAVVADLKTRQTSQQAAVEAGGDLASLLAAAQYRNGNASEMAELMLAKDPYEAVVLAELLAAAGRSQSEFLDKLKADRASLTVLQQLAEASLAQAQALLTQQESAKADVARRLTEVEQMVSSLTGAQRSELEQLEKTRADEAQLAFLASGALGKGERTPSQAGRKAVAFALAQLGKDYLWGGTGPDKFDCSGLTSQAWLAAGVRIPRVSQDQWAELAKVPLNQMRPGDLVVYYAGATHIGMYIGGGLVVQAPRTGAVIKVSPVGAMPILGAVRPDPESAPDEQGGAWKVPDLPKGADAVTPIQPTKQENLPQVPATPQQPGTGPATTPPPATGTPSGSGSPSGSGTPSGSGSPSGSGTPSGSGSPSPTDTPSGSGSPSGSGTPSGSGSASPSADASAPGTPSADASESGRSASASASGSGSTAGSTATP
ncbi:NlpC/P60 family protein [Kitasatospora sp. NPDC051853]|uniref:C40 family peptidase n=1 Tax=Kitasatospora sp. NPDC051853 TaxID=3364058 RepID=UPI0037A1AADF